MDDELTRLLQTLDLGAPTSEDALASLVERVRETYGASLPEDYVAFLRRANGADGNLPGGNAIVLWEAKQVPGVNEDNEAESFMPGLLVIGSDTGDYAYGIDLRADAPAERYAEIEWSALDWDDVLWRGGSFLELLKYSDREN